MYIFENKAEKGWKERQVSKRGMAVVQAEMMRTQNRIMVLEKSGHILDIS